MNVVIFWESFSSSENKTMPHNIGNFKLMARQKMTVFFTSVTFSALYEKPLFYRTHLMRANLLWKRTFPFSDRETRAFVREKYVSPGVQFKTKEQ